MPDPTTPATAPPPPNFVADWRAALRGACQELHRSAVNVVDFLDAVPALSPAAVLEAVAEPDDGDGPSLLHMTKAAAARLDDLQTLLLGVAAALGERAAALTSESPVN